MGAEAGGRVKALLAYGKSCHKVREVQNPSAAVVIEEQMLDIAQFMVQVNALKQGQQCLFRDKHVSHASYVSERHKYCCVTETDST